MEHEVTRGSALTSIQAVLCLYLDCWTSARESGREQSWKAMVKVRVTVPAEVGYSVENCVCDMNPIS